jgi:hypothetical protein
LQYEHQILDEEKMPDQSNPYATKVELDLTTFVSTVTRYFLLRIDNKAFSIFLWVWQQWVLASSQYFWA